MADEEVATRAPEGDVQIHTTTSSEASAGIATPTTSASPTHTASIVPGDTPAQSGPTMGEHCTTDRPLPTDSATPAGELSTIDDVSCYITKPSSYPHNPGKLLLLLTGGTGINSVNNQLQADAYAERGYLVVMPDQFAGDPAPKAATVATAEGERPADGQQEERPTSPSILDRIKLGAAETAKSFLIDMWLARHTPEKVLPILHKVLAGAHEQFADAVANGGGVYGVGYCFGAKYVLLLCGENSSEVATSAWSGLQPSKENNDVERGDAEKKPELKAGAIAHGTLITKDDIEGVRQPIAMACVQNDSLFPDDVREQGRASLELNAVDHHVEVFDSVPHGFAVLGDYSDEKIQVKQKEAFEMMCGWLEAH